MSNYEEVDDERAARIDQGFDDMHRFLRNLLDDPTPLQLIPDGSTLQFRTVRVDDDEMQLTAHRLPDSSGPWTARVTSCEIANSPVDASARVPENVEGSPNGHRMSRCVEHRHRLVRVASTSQAALDAVEEVVCSSAARIATG
ncbi:MAG: hypothetical protein M3464_15795 [Chloroflexota bacterium]|nr:hypothetical protein [Chloroflexota bacterium]